MKEALWRKLIASSPDGERALRYFKALHESGGEQMDAFEEDAAAVLVKLLATSRALSEQLLATPEWLSDLATIEGLRHARQEQGFRREVNGFLSPALERQDYAGAYRQLRLFKQRQTLRVAARDRGAGQRKCDHA
jgi:glutamine synthetase adenylyltransferase